MTGALVSPRRRPWSRRIARWLLFFVSFFVLVYLSLCGALYWAMWQPPDVFGRFMMKITKLPEAVGMVMPFETLWMRARAGKLQPGEMAPDFNLPTLDHKDTVRLSSFRGVRPVVLVFGSYT
jgi:hypothetical protein